MTATETLYAFESHLITEAEAVEQVMCDRIDDVYEKAAAEHSLHGKSPVRDARTTA